MFILKKGHQPGVYVPLRALFLVGNTSCIFKKRLINLYIKFMKMSVFSSPEPKAHKVSLKYTSRASVCPFTLSNMNISTTSGSN